MADPKQEDTTDPKQEEETVVEEQTNHEEKPVSNDLHKHTQKQKESIIKTIGNTIWMGVEELGNTIGGADKQKKPAPQDASHQISSKQEKREENIIKKRGVHED